MPRRSRLRAALRRREMLAFLRELEHGMRELGSGHWILLPTLARYRLLRWANRLADFLSEENER